MNPDDIKTAITGWANQGGALQLVEDRTDPNAEFALGLRVSGQGSGSVPVDVSLERGAERLTVRSAGGGSGKDFTDLLATRPAMVSGDSGGVVGYVYLDGFSRQTFTAVTNEVAKTRSLVDALGAGTTAAAAQESTQQEPWVPAGATQPETWSGAASIPSQTPAASLPTPSFGGAPGYTPPSGQPAQQPQPVTTPAFAPTHTVPPQGMQAWALPDPNGPVVATLGGGLPIQVSEVRGAWARVICSNGWTGWVDGRIIGVAY